jgi:hypothetical protein
MKHARWPTILLVFYAVHGALSPPLTANAADTIAGRLIVRDALTTPGRPVMIEAQLIRSGFLGQGGVGGEQLDFWVGEKKAGTAMTGGDGRAFFEYISRMRGTQVITVKLANSRRVESPEATATLACWERRRPILLVDLAALTEEPPSSLLPLPSLPLPIGREDQPAPIPDAADELKRLTAYYFNVIYLARSGPADLGGRGDPRAWLRANRFPVGLLMTVTQGRAALSETIETMEAQGWDNLKAGIGRTREFAEILVDHRMEVVIIPHAERDDNLPKKAIVAKDWKEIRRKLRS